MDNYSDTPDGFSSAEQPNTANEDQYSDTPKGFSSTSKKEPEKSSYESYMKTLSNTPDNKLNDDQKSDKYGPSTTQRAMNAGRLFAQAVLPGGQAYIPDNEATKAAKSANPGMWRATQGLGLVAGSLAGGAALPLKTGATGIGALLNGAARSTAGGMVGGANEAGREYGTGENLNLGSILGNAGAGAAIAGAPSMLSSPASLIGSTTGKTIGGNIAKGVGLDAVLGDPGGFLKGIYNRGVAGVHALNGLDLSSIFNGAQ